jgi:hypothetical protein
VTIRYIHIEDAMPRGDVMRVMGALYDRGRQLTDVGSLVKEFQLSTSDDVAMIRQTATGIRSNAVQTTLLANQLSELAGRLDTVASFLESAQDLDRDDEIRTSRTDKTNRRGSSQSLGRAGNGPASSWSVLHGNVPTSATSLTER